MPKTQLLKSEIQEIQKLKDIAEIMSAIAAGNLMQYKSVRNHIGALYESITDTDGNTALRPKDHLLVMDELSKNLFSRTDNMISFSNPNEDVNDFFTMYIGSDMGFCGKFNKGVKELAKKRRENMILIGKQLSGLRAKPISFPDVNVKGSPQEKVQKIIDILYAYSKEIYANIISSHNSFNLVFNVLHDQTVILHQCLLKKQKLEDIATLQHEFFDLYSKASNDDKEYVILDPGSEAIYTAFSDIQDQFFIQLITVALVDSIIAENHARSSSMESTKDEAQQIMNQLNKQMAKERQARITGELIELITSFTSLNQSV